MSITELDLAIIGAGPAGLAAGARSRMLGVKDVVLFDRDERPGGILPQCIHPGFGLVRYKEELTGPEYAWRALHEAQSQGVNIELNTMVIEADRNRVITVVSPSRGNRRYRCKAIIFAMGCRERTRQAIRIPGTRPAGIFTAGKAQRLVNIEGYLPGRRVVIIGSGDIGMIMARRLTLEGCKVEAVIEINPYTSGLIRNEVQCLRDFCIPLYLAHEVTEIHGSRRVEGITMSQRDAEGHVVPGSERYIACDAILLSVGLIPENELTRQAGLCLDPSTGGPEVGNLLETGTQGFFACGNVLHVNDLVDEVSREGERAAEGAAARLGVLPPPPKIGLRLIGGANIAQVVPQRLVYETDSRIAIRVKHPTGPASVRIGNVARLRLPLTRPGEMITCALSREQIRALSGEDAQEVRIECE